MLNQLSANILGNYHRKTSLYTRSVFIIFSVDAVAGVSRATWMLSLTHHGYS